MKNFNEIIAFAKERGPKTISVACAQDKEVLLAVEAARKEGIALSLHAPYYINLATDEDEKRSKNMNYLLDSVKFSRLMGADRIVLHPGGASKGRTEALARAEVL